MVISHRTNSPPPSPNILGRTSVGAQQSTSNSHSTIANLLHHTSSIGAWHQWQLKKILISSILYRVVSSYVLIKAKKNWGSLIISILLSYIIEAIAITKNWHTCLAELEAVARAHSAVDRLTTLLTSGLWSRHETPIYNYTGHAHSQAGRKAGIYRLLVAHTKAIQKNLWRLHHNRKHYSSSITSRL